MYCKFIGRSVSVLLLGVLLSVFNLSAQEVVYDPAKWGTTMANQATNIETWANQLANIEENLRVVTRSKELFTSAYAISNLLGGSQKLNELISTVSEYRSLYNSVSDDIDRYSSYGLVSTRQVAYSTSIMVRGLNRIIKDVAYVSGHVIKDEGLSANERLTLIDSLQMKCRNEIDKLLTIRKEVVTKPVQHNINVQMSHYINAGMSPVPTLGPVREMTEGEESANDAAVNDPYIRELLTKAEKASQKRNLSDVESSGKGLYKNAVDIATYLICIVAALMFVFAFERRNRGEHQSNDSIYKVCIGLIFAVVALQIVSRLFLY